VPADSGAFFPALSFELESAPEDGRATVGGHGGPPH